jgi:hypothetical protein
LIQFPANIPLLGGDKKAEERREKETGLIGIKNPTKELTKLFKDEF